MTLDAEYWATLDRFRQATDIMFAKDILSDPALISGYDQIMSAGREAITNRGIDLDQEEQRYVVTSTIQWTLNIVTGLLASNPCVDEHILAHVRSAISWPAFLVRELTLNLPLPIIPPEAPDGV